MTEKDFRYWHSKLIENYQLIEMRLRSIYAAMKTDADKTWFELCDDYAQDSMGAMIAQICDYQESHQIKWLSDNDLEELERIRKRRNYWCHECFISPTHVCFIDKAHDDSVVRDKGHVEQIVADLNDADNWDKKLTEVFCEHEHVYK